MPCALAGHGFRAAPYSCRGAIDVKLIINLSPALEGLCDWQSFAEACRVEAGEQQNQQNHGDCQGAAAVPDGIWSKNQHLVRLSLPPRLSGHMERLYEGPCPSACIIKGQVWS